MHQIDLVLKLVRTVIRTAAANPTDLLSMDGSDFVKQKDLQGKKASDEVLNENQSTNDVNNFSQDMSAKIQRSSCEMDEVKKVIENAKSRRLELDMQVAQTLEKLRAELQGKLNETNSTRNVRSNGDNSNAIPPNTYNNQTRTVRRVPICI